MKKLAAVLVAMLSCPSPGADEVVATVIDPAPNFSAQAQVHMQAVASTRSVRRIDERPIDFYEGWSSWCEGPAVPCQKDDECSADRTGRTRKCIRPWWSKKDRFCAVPFMGRAEHREAEAKIRRIVNAQCGKRCDLEKLSRFVLLVAGRESSLRHWKLHRLNPDIVASRTSWTRSRKAYVAAGNPFIHQRNRWLGWGLMGQQSPTFTMLWDLPSAPPEILCRAPVAIYTYLSMSRRAWTKQASLGIVPTWATIHDAVSLGRVRPKGRNADFEARARRAGIDPDERVRKEDLGMVVGVSPQARNAWLAILEADLLLPLEER